MSGFEINGVPVQKLRVVDLKEELDARGLSKTGKKDELIARLVSYMEANPEEGAVKDSDEGSSDSKDEMMKKWQEEREQLLRENEERRQEEERKQKAEEEQKKKAEEERLAQEAAAAKAKAEEEQARREKEAAAAEEEKRKASEEAERKKAEAEAERKRQDEEKEAQRVQEEKERQEKVAAEERDKQEKEQKRKEEERRLKEEELKRKADEEQKLLEEKEAKEKQEKAKETSEKVAEEESKDEVGEDTLVMEIDQHDLVAEDTEPEEAVEPEKEGKKQPEIPVEAGQVKSLRKLGGSKTGNEERKRGWGVSKVTNGTSSSISSDSLKDIVPDPKPLMENTEAAIEEGETGSIESDPDVAGPKVPDSVKKEEEPVKKKKKITLTEDDNESPFVLIRNLTRPFTLKGFQEMLKRTGTLEDFWIDRIKSTCCVKFASSDQASETRMALDGVTWPVGNPKTLSVTFISEETMNKYKQTADGVLKPTNDREKERDRVREWDRNKTEERGDERRGDRDKRADREREVRLREKSRERTPPPPTKSLEDLFKKTTATPSIYWKPLSDQQIKERIELRNKRMAEAKILKEMQETKDTLEKSQKLLSRRSRSRNNRRSRSSS